MSERPVEAGHYRGWLWKWTNYIKGYQRRWFVLSDGLLSYYRSQAEMAHTCRGTINLAGAFIVTEESCNFTVSNGGTQTFHLKANHEVERQRWITALELAKAKLVSWGNDGSSDDEESFDDNHKHSPAPIGEENDVITSLKALTTKLDDLQTCHDLITKHGNALQKAVTELEVAGANFNDQNNESMSTLSKKVTERAALFRITSTAMISTSSDFLKLAQEQSKRWRKAILHERSQRLRMEETVESLAKQHNTLERAIRSEKKMYDMNNFDEYSNHSSGESDAEEFEDALDEYDTEPNNAHATHTLVPAVSAQIKDVATTSQANNQTSSHFGNTVATKKTYRVAIPFKPDYSLSLWSIMKNCIGRDLSKIPMPVNFNEPLSMLQRLGEDVEYCHLLNTAAKLTNSYEQMAYVVAFSISGYASTIYRIGKPFNPLLGETFELDRIDDFGVRMLCEQVGHHPPCAAFHIESKDCSPTTGWTYWTDITVSSKFRGKYLSVSPLGTMHLKFHASGNHYTWKKVTTTVHNIIVGKLWVDQSGDCEVVNQTTGDVCKHKYHQYSYFSRDVARRVTGLVEDKRGKAHLKIFGTWDKYMEYSPVTSNDKSPNTSGKPIWTTNPHPVNSDKMYFFSKLALQINEHESSVAPTDSRNRPDQRHMENGNWDVANEVKTQLEQAQRTRRTARKAAFSLVSSDNSLKKAPVSAECWMPVWFEKSECEISGDSCYKFNGDYWKCKDAQDWSKCTDIFTLDPKSGESSKQTPGNKPNNLNDIKSKPERKDIKS